RGQDSVPTFDHRLTPLRTHGSRTLPAFGAPVKSRVRDVRAAGAGVVDPVSGDLPQPGAVLDPPVPPGQDPPVPRRLLAATILAVQLGALAWAGFTPEQQRALDEAKYVYIQSERKSGEWSKPAEIWFFVDGGKLYVGTRPSSWRVRRAKAGRTKARIAIGSP